MAFYQVRWVLLGRELALPHSSPATKIEGPGIAWAFVLSGATSVTQSL